MNTKKNKKAGFTLVELMVVAIIVAILAAVAIPLMTGNKDRAMATEGQAGISTISTAMRVAKAESATSTYPVSGTDVTTLPGIKAKDLDGRYFDDGSYSWTTTGDDYKIEAKMTSDATKTVTYDTSVSTKNGYAGSLLD